MRERLLQMPVWILSMALLLGLAVMQIVLPDSAFSAVENRPLAKLPAPSPQRVLSGRWMQEAQTYVNDQLPGRDGWMNVQAALDRATLRLSRNGILQGGAGWLFEPCANLSVLLASRNMAALDALLQGTDAPVTLLLVPLSSAVYPEHLPDLYRPDDPKQMLDTLAALVPSAEAIDLLAALGAEKAGGAPPLFFRTDHHWTDAGAGVAYAALKRAWALPETDGSAETATYAGMYGSYYARAPSPWIKGEVFTVTYPAGLQLAVEGEAMPGLYDAAAMHESRDKYARLLYGNHGRVTITGGAETGTLLVLRDSYADLLLPRLAQHFARVEAIDPRYYAGDLGGLIDEMEADAILCLYGLTTLLTDRSLLLQSPA